MLRVERWNVCLFVEEKVLVDEEGDGHRFPENPYEAGRGAIAKSSHLYDCVNSTAHPLLASDLLGRKKHQVIFPAQI